MENNITRTTQEFEEIRNIIILHRSHALRSINEESLLMSWNIGKYISSKLKTNEWGSKIVNQLAEYLRVQDPSIRGYSRRNIYNMIAFYDAYSSPQFNNLAQQLKLQEIVQLQSAQATTAPFVQTESAQMPEVLLLTTFSNHIEILNKCKNMEERVFYILYAYKENLNCRELQRCITNATFASFMGDKTNLSIGLKNTYKQSTAMFKDTAFLDFLNLPKQHNEKQLQTGILEHMKQFVLELGKDFLFVGSQYPLHVGSSTFRIDLLFYHRGLQCLIAIELKAQSFKPEFMGQLEFYLEALDRDVKRSNENPSIGILLCQSADHSIVEYAMSRSMSPTMVTEYKRQLIPKEILQKSLDEFCSFVLKH